MKVGPVGTAATQDSAFFETFSIWDGKTVVLALFLSGAALYTLRKCQPKPSPPPSFEHLMAQGPIGNRIAVRLSSGGYRALKAASPQTYRLERRCPKVRWLSILQELETSLPERETFPEQGDYSNSTYLLHLINKLDRQLSIDVYTSIPSWTFRGTIRSSAFMHSELSSLYQEHLRKLIAPARACEYRNKAAATLELAKEDPMTALCQVPREEPRYQQFLLGALAIHAHPSIWQVPGGLLDLFNVRQGPFTEAPRLLRAIYLLKTILASTNVQVKNDAKALIRKKLVGIEEPTSPV